MKIFGITFETKKELRAKNAELESKATKLLVENRELCNKIVELATARNSAKADLSCMQQMFPFELGQTVFDVALKNAQGKYTKKNPSVEHSTITEVVVSEKNYFSLVKRFKSNDVFTSPEAAEEYLKSICK